LCTNCDRDSCSNFAKEIIPDINDLIEDRNMIYPSDFISCVYDLYDSFDNEEEEEREEEEEEEDEEEEEEEEEEQKENGKEPSPKRRKI